MKRSFSILFILALIIIACDNKSKEKKGPEIDSAGIKAREEAAVATEKVAEELEKLTPLTEEQIRGLMPETLMGTPLSDYSYNSTLGVSLATGEYKINDSANITLNIYDCAGPGGAGLYNVQFAGQLDYSIDTDNEYTKVIDFNSGKAIEHCSKTSVECSLTWFSGRRFLVTLESNNVNADELKKIARGLNIK